MRDFFDVCDVGLELLAPVAGLAEGGGDLVARVLPWAFGGGTALE